MKKHKYFQLFFSINKFFLTLSALYILYGISGFFYYMTAYDFIIYVMLVFLLAQTASVLATSFIYAITFIVELKINKYNFFDKIYHTTEDIGRGVNIFLFILVFERAVIYQSWLSRSMHINEISRLFIEVTCGFFIVMLVWYLRFRGRRDTPREAAKATTDDDRRAINRRVFVTTATSAVAAAAIGTRLVLQKGFPLDSTGASNGKNILLITFDTLTAKDMSLYGYSLPTTPNIDKFSLTSDVYENFYSCSTFTTPSIATILTGQYPSQSRVYHLRGGLHGSQPSRTLPALLKAAGYSTASIFGNPFAMRLMGSTGGAFDHLSEGPRTSWTGQPPADLMTLPGATDLYNLSQRVQAAAGLAWPPFRQMNSETPPTATFDAALAQLSTLKGPFFMWIHVMAPHAPYLPSREFRHQFLKPGVFETRQDMLHPRVIDRNKPQAVIKADIAMLRLRYDEWIREADAAFGSFMSSLGQSGLLDTTATMVSSDHGEFFGDNAFGHGGDDFVGPLIHIPMVIKRPGQSVGRRLKSFADQTAIAPTILDLAGLAVPDWMAGSALDRHAATGGMAVTQYLERNSVFENVSNGTLGAVFGEYQYVRSLDTGAEALYSLAEADRRSPLIGQDMTHTMEEARETLRLKFPELFF